MDLQSFAVLFFLLVYHCDVITSSTWVRLPVSYTAMKGDIVVSFDLSNSTQSNSVVHIESIETGSRVAELPIPMGLVSGAVIFPCGVVVHGGPHKAVLTNGGKMIAESPSLNVLWPAVRLDVPSRLETFESDVTVKVSFTANICAPMSKRRDNFHYHVRKRDSNVPFRVFLHLVKCQNVETYSEKVDSATYCSLPQNESDSRIWFTSAITDDFYRHSSYDVHLNCQLWSEEGNFRVFLTTNLTSSRVIGGSAIIRVVNNRKFALDSYFTSVLPCHSGDIKPIAVSRPTCSPQDDRVRAYAQEHRVVGGNIVPTNKRYLGEVRILPGDNLAIFPCEMLSDISGINVLEVCFRYITSSIAGTTYNPVSLCLPATMKDARRPQPEWSPWNEWSSCSSSCGREGTKFRHRFCQTSDKSGIKLLCKGQPVEYLSCDGPPCVMKPLSNNLIESSTTFSPTEKVSTNTWKPISSSESSSPCSCGCIFVVSRSRDLSITSGLDCPSLPISWKLKVSIGELIETSIHLIEFSCSNSIFHLRDGGRNNDEIIFETEFDFRTNLNFVRKNSSKEIVGFEFMAPRRSCRINIRIIAHSIPSNLLSKEDMSSQHLDTWLTHLYNHLPIAIILLLSIVIVTLLSSICLAVRFEWERKKYVAWKSQPSSGYSTPNILDHERNCFQPIEDIHTSSEDIPILTKDKKRKRKRGYESGSKGRFRRAADVLRKHFSSKKSSKINFRSLPPSPFMTRRLSLDSIETRIIGQQTVTGSAVKRAAHLKSLRYQRGDFGRPTKRPRPPATSPTKHFSMKRHSRSLSDISSLISFKLKEGALLKEVPGGRDNQHQVEVYSLKPPRDSDLRSVHFSSPDPSVSKASSRRFLDRSSKERLNSIQNRAKRLTISSSNSTLNGRSIGGSSDTLKAAGSISEFSQHSGDPELEFDLYDCDLNNASAMPGSYFAPAYSWDCDYDVTPTGEEEEFELSDFFPDKSRNDDNRVSDLNHMNSSRTSDLTTSVTSSNNEFTFTNTSTLRNGVDSNLDSSAYYTNDDETDEEDDHFRETSTLLRKSTLLNMTHIDDDIAFADEETRALNV